MKKKFLTLASALFLTLVSSNAQVIYSLPSTTITINVTAEKEIFTAGPYAKYAQKYLGSAAKTTNEVNYSLKEITVRPYVEIDPSETYVIKTHTGSLPETFIKMCSQGLILYSDSQENRKEQWRFPAPAPQGNFDTKDMGENLTSATTTLYKKVKSENSFKKVAVQQSEVVEKSQEKKAAEAAQRIFDLRKSRFQIITGDTDATYSGEAMGAALKEISRLEDEYLSLFYGISETSLQKMNFDVTPSSGNKEQIYVAFRISETEGLLPNSDLSGRPIIMSLQLNEKLTLPEKSSGSKFGNQVNYRIPVTATVKLMDSQKLLLQTRMPIYQLGTKVTINL